ncbi:hypothetical protein LCGC14_0959070 [marine sediment metagenome]|uniref:Uncharacterized protein n=1 Tax=marine sediment metagenome TaxID=412755 RepID=A0A0F9NEW4_9ZZZZ
MSKDCLNPTYGDFNECDGCCIQSLCVAAKNILNPPKDLHSDPDEHYEVWVMLERWKGDSKLEEVETCKVGNVVDEDGGRELFDAAQTMSMSVRNLIESTVKVYDD